MRIMEDLKSTKCRKITRSPVRLAEIAFSLAQQALPRYSSRKSRKDYSQAQLFAMLVVKAYFKTDFRNVIGIFHDFAELRKAIKLKKVPHYSTLCYAEERLIKKGPSSYFKKPHLIDTRLWRMLERSRQESSTLRDLRPDTPLDTIVSVLKNASIVTLPEDGRRSR